jgi:hypothetical protein
VTCFAGSEIVTIGEHHFPNKCDHIVSKIVALGFLDGFYCGCVYIDSVFIKNCIYESFVLLLLKKSFYFYFIFLNSE